MAAQKNLFAEKYKSRLIGEYSSRMAEINYITVRGDGGEENEEEEEVETEESLHDGNPLNHFAFQSVPRPRT